MPKLNSIFFLTILGASIGATLNMSLIFDSNYWFISFSTMVIFFYSLEKLTSSKTKFYSYCLSFSIGWFLLSSGHIFLGLYVGGDLNIFLSILSFLIIFLYCYFFIFICFYVYYQQHNLSPWLRILSFISLWGLFEWLRTSLFGGYTLMSFGYFHTRGIFSGFAPVGGVLLISLFVLTISMICGFALNNKIPKYQAGVILMLFIVTSYYLGGINWSKENNKQVTVSLVQTGELVTQRYSSERLSKEEIVEEVKRMLDKISYKADLVVTPEGFLPGFFSHYPASLFSYLNKWSNDHKASVVLGSFVLHPDGFGPNGGFQYFSSIFLSNDQLQLPIKSENNWWQGENVAFYHKRELIPFAEYVPWFAKSIGLRGWLPMSNGEAGVANKTQWEVKSNFWIAPSICYEMYFGDSIKDNAIGADLLVNQAFQGWFSSGFGIEVQHKISRMRAIEAARPVLRVDGYGISGLIGPKGEDVMRLPVGSSEINEVKVHGYTGITPYYRYGYLPLLLILSFLWLAAFILLSVTSTRILQPGVSR